MLLFLRRRRPYVQGGIASPNRGCEEVAVEALRNERHRWLAPRARPFVILSSPSSFLGFFPPEHKWHANSENWRQKLPDHYEHVKEGEERKSKETNALFLILSRRIELRLETGRDQENAEENIRCAMDEPNQQQDGMGPLSRLSSLCRFSSLWLR